MKKKINTNRFKFKFSAFRAFLFLIILTSCLISLYYSNSIETLINVGYSEDFTVLDEDGLQVHFVDVGQGDAIVIEFPDGNTMLIDAGTTSVSDELIAYINSNIFEAGEEPVFEYMVITHSHEDHVGGMDEILDEYQINNIYRPKIYASYNDTEVVLEGMAEEDTQSYARVIERVLTEPNCNVILSATDMLISGGSGADAYSLTFLSPIESYYSDINEYSPIMLLEYKGKRIMLTGDATMENEENILEKYDLPKVDLLKLGHHGSNTSTSEELLNQIDITYAVISVGEDNSYNHPSQETINRLLYSGVSQENIYATDENGSIIANVNLQGDLNIFSDVENMPTYVEWEYIVSIIIIIGFSCCFMQGKKL